ncbi:hypothetical protein KKG52_00255 [Patescibacteria group bacterium]|nr:hypothetical protein [Patescibacteria group bacterium]
MFYIVLIFIIVISIGLSVWSLRKMLNTKEIREVKEDLKKGKVIFKNPKL